MGRLNAPGAAVKIVDPAPGGATGRELKTMRYPLLEKLTFSLLIVVWLVWGGNFIADLLVSPDETGVAALRLVTVPAESATPAAVPAESAAPAATPAVEGPAALIAAASPEAGAKVFRKCKACHGDAKGGKHKVGPNLWDMVGRAKGSAAGYRYSGTMAGLGGTWTYTDLDAFLTNPRGYAKGTKMTFKGIKGAADRAAVIAYLRTLSDSPKPLP